MHVGGVDKIVARSWVGNKSDFSSPRYQRTKLAATLSINAYRSLDPDLKIIVSRFFQGLNCTFLDHFRAGFQHEAWRLETMPGYFIRFELQNDPPNFRYLVRFDRPFECQIFFTRYLPRRENYVASVAVRKRGFVCQQRHWARPPRIGFDGQSGLGTGWTAWFEIPYGNELSVYAGMPTPSNPLPPWFGPFPIERLAEIYDEVIGL